MERGQYLYPPGPVLNGYPDTASVLSPRKGCPKWLLGTKPRRDRLIFLRRWMARLVQAILIYAIVAYPIQVEAHGLVETSIRGVVWESNFVGKFSSVSLSPLRTIVLKPSIEKHFAITPINCLGDCDWNYETQKLVFLLCRDYRSRGAAARFNIVVIKIVRQIRIADRQINMVMPIQGFRVAGIFDEPSERPFSYLTVLVGSRKILPTLNSGDQGPIGNEVASSVGLLNYLRPLDCHNEEQAIQAEKAKPNSLHLIAGVPLPGGDGTEQKHSDQRQPKYQELRHCFSLHDLTKLSALTGLAAFFLGIFLGAAAVEIRGRQKSNVLQSDGLRTYCNKGREQERG